MESRVLETTERSVKVGSYFLRDSEGYDVNSVRRDF